MNKKILGLAILLGILGLSQMGLAQIVPGAQPLGILIHRFLGIILGVIVIVAVIFILLGAFQFFTAGGDPEKASQAKQQIVYAVIGLFIAAAAAALVNWVIARLGVQVEQF